MATGEPEHPDAPRVYELAFSEGVRALSEQQAVIDSFRTRSGLLLSGADALGDAPLGGRRLAARSPAPECGVQ